MRVGYLFLNLMRSSRVRNLILSVAVLVGLWWAGCAALRSSLFVCPPDVLLTLLGLLGSSDLYGHFGASVLRVVEGYALSVLLAIPIAFLCTRSLGLKERLVPIHDFIRYIPVPAFVPLCAVFFGVGDFTKVSLIFIGTYFQLVFMYILNIASIPRQIEESGRCLGLRGFKLWRTVTFRASLPGLLESSRIAFAWAWSYLLVAEVVNARQGVGYLVLQSYRVLAMDRLLALLVVIGAWGMLSDLAFRKVNSVICPWQQGGKSAP